ncbi:guanylate-binding protein [Rhizophagus irregularis DAOM 181602=DAOM 197198]|nr:guanylate-binding protein [Rhizophagus irregularis DAOM 181602=DAOM 197198]
MESNENFESTDFTDFIENGNKFGGGIEFRKGGPIQLLKYEEGSKNRKFGQILINPEALNILQAIREPIAIISVVGSFHRGKSWFANVLHGHHDSFNLGPGVEGCTRGIYMWSPPFKLSNEQSDGETIQKRVIILDSEGIDDPNQDPNWATKLFILSLAIASTFIYNINGIIGKDDIGKLHLMTDLSKFIQEPKDGDFLPRLVILLRDFMFESSDTPGMQKKIIATHGKVGTNDLDEDFVKEVESTVKAIYSQLPSKYIGSSTMKGVSFVKFLQNIVECMNDSETSNTISIPSEYESITQFVAQVAIKEATEFYEERMNTLKNEGKLPILWEEFEETHIEYISEIDKLFFEKIIGSPKQIGSFVEQLHEKIFEFKKEFRKINSRELMIYNGNIAKKVWSRYIDNKINSFKNNEEFQAALESFELAYDKSMKKSLKANKVITSYKRNQYPAAIDHMKQLGIMNKRLAEAMYLREETDRLRREAFERTEAIRIETAAFEREREKFRENFESKISELQKNIEEQRKCNGEMNKVLEDFQKI